MSANTDIRNGYYGKVTYNKKTKTETFTPLGRAVILNKIRHSIEKNEIVLELSYCYGYYDKKYNVTKGDLTDPNICKDLANAGIDVTRKNFDYFVESINMQEEAYLRNQQITFCYSYLGWIETTMLNFEGRKELCYRGHKLITATSSTKQLYQGNFHITPKGSYDTWKAMVVEHVTPYIPMSIALLCSLSSVVSGLLCTRFPIGNGILNLCAISSSGKTTSAFLDTSVSGEPFTVVRKVLDENNNEVCKLSLLQSFSATDNALIGKLAGMQGVPIIIDELGKYKGNDITSLVFDLFDGNSKARMNKDLSVTELPGFHGTIITMGEFSIFEKCKKKIEGIRNRVFEMKDKLTVSAEHSEIIKTTCVENNGFAAPILAKYILQNGGVDMILKKYETWRIRLKDELPKVDFGDKFIDTFPALYLTTAEIAKEALDIEFKVEEIVAYFKEYLSNSDNKMNVSLESYDYLIKEFKAHNANFYRERKSNYIETNGEIWGRYIGDLDKVNEDGKKIVGEYLVRTNTVEKLLKQEKYTKSQCVDAWKKNYLISYEAGHNTRSRKIDLEKPAEDVYVFYIFEQKGDEEDEYKDANPKRDWKVSSNFVSHSTRIRKI